MCEDSERPEWQDYVDDAIEDIATSIRMEFMVELDDLREQIAKLKSGPTQLNDAPADANADVSASTSTNTNTYTLPEITIVSNGRVQTGQSALGGLGAYTTKSERIETLKDERKAKVSAASGASMRTSALDRFMK
jgi:hypothetical protein